MSSNCDQVMANNARFAEVASIAGEPARASMLHALMDGRALTASELARVAGVTPQTASGHLAKMAASRLVLVEKQGRRHYHRLASPAVAQMMESIMLVAALETRRTALVTGPREAALRMARTCYDHLAGRLGVSLADALVTRGYVDLHHDGGLVTDAGISLLQRIGIDVTHLTIGRGKNARVLCRPCLDWSERRPHLAGALGAALCAFSLKKGWIRRRDGTRAVTVTPEGIRIYRDAFGMRLDY